MNAYEIVEKLMKEKRYYISYEELNAFGEEREVVKAILLSKYNAAFYSDFNSIANGYWYFDNPYMEKRTYYVLGYIIKNREKPKLERYGSALASNEGVFERFSEVIYLLENLTSEKQMYISNKLKTEKVFNGEVRLWYLWEEEKY